MTDDLARAHRRGTSPSLMDGPWGDTDVQEVSGGDDDGNPWTRPARGTRSRLRPSGQPSLEELIRRSRARLGGGLPGGGGRPIWGWALAAFVLLWLLTTSIHQIDPQERGVVTRLGRYQATLSPGLALTLPAPLDVVSRVNVDQINSLDVPDSGDAAVLAQDGGLVDLAYTVRWSVRDPERFLFDLAEPEATLRAVAESAMREAMGRASADAVAGSGGAGVEADAQARAQAVLDRYHAGIRIDGVAIREADPPAAVADATRDIAAAREQAQAYVSAAQGYAQQVNTNAADAATAFNKVYQAYRMAPEVTRKRMYYETMEAVLARNNKVIVDAPGSAITLPPPPHAAAPAPTQQDAATPAPPSAGNGQ